MMKIYVIAFSLLIFSSITHAEQWHFATFEAHPYMCQSCENEGTVLSTISNILAEKNITPIYTYMSYARAIVTSRKEQYVGYILDWPSDMPEEFFIASNNLFDEEIILVSHISNSQPWSSLQELKGKRFGAIIGYGYGEEFEALRANGDVIVEEVADAVINFKKLLSNRIDYVLTYKNQILSIVDEEGMDIQDFTIHEPVIAVFPTIIAINKNHPDHEDILQKINTWFADVSFE